LTSKYCRIAGVAAGGPEEDVDAEEEEDVVTRGTTV